MTLLVKQSQQIPSTLSHVAVILNGWHFTYLEGDHEVLGLATGLFDLQRTVQDDGSHLLEWQAFGVIRDGNYDDPFRWCYHFTVVAWDGAAYAAQVDQRDARGLIGDAVGREVPFGWQTALSFHPSFVEVYPAGSAVAMILPRGFGSPGRSGTRITIYCSWRTISIPGRRSSPMAGSTRGRVRLSTAADRAGRTYYSWETKTVFKDDALRRYLTSRASWSRSPRALASSGPAPIHHRALRGPIRDLRRLRPGRTGPAQNPRPPLSRSRSPC